MTHTTIPSAAPQPGSPRPDDTVLLSGWPLRLARGLLFVLALWVAVVAVFSIPALRAFTTEVQPAFHALHLRPIWTKGPFVAQWNGGIAEKAGLPSGVLLAIDDQPVAKNDSVFDVADRLRGPIDSPVKLTVRGESGVVARRLVRSAPLWREGLSPALVSLISGLLAAVVSLFGGLALIWRGGPGLVSIVGSTSFLCLSASGFSEVLERQVGGGWSHPIFTLTTPLGVLMLFTFLTLFPNGRIQPRWAWSILVIAVVEQIRRGFDLDFPMPLVFVLSVGIFPMILAAQILRYRRHATTEQRQQTKWAVLGIASFTSSFLVVIPLSFLLQDHQALMRELLFSIVTLALFAFMAGVVISVLKYRLWDAEAAWSRSAMAAGLTLAVTAIIAVGTALAQSAFGASGPVALGLATAAAAVLLLPIQHRLSEWAKRRFLRDLMELKDHLPQLVGHLRETETVEGIADAVTTRVAPVVHATHAALVMPDSQGGWAAAGVEGIDNHSVEAWAASAELASPPLLQGTWRHPWRDRVWSKPEDRLFPVRVALRSERAGGELALEGWLVLGPRPDGSGYGPDDLEAVAETAGPIGRALRVVRVREDRANQLAAMLASRDAAQAEQLDRIQAQLRKLLPE